jgi:hypothetical protein
LEEILKKRQEEGSELTEADKLRGVVYSSTSSSTEVDSVFVRYMTRCLDEGWDPKDYGVLVLFEFGSDDIEGFKCVGKYNFRYINFKILEEKAEAYELKIAVFAELKLLSSHFVKNQGSMTKYEDKELVKKVAGKELEIKNKIVEVIDRGDYIQNSES